jgi:predicted nuclease of predicted toxin-antitoxin system
MQRSLTASVRFLANMNISPKTVTALRQQGWEIIRLSDLLPVDATDEEVLELARREDWVVITQDLDFSTLVALSGYDRPSLITLRLSVSDPETVTQRLLEVLPQIEQFLRKGCAVTIEDIAVRVRHLPIR